MSPAEFRKRTRFIVRLGRALHACGTTSDSIERHLTNATRMLDLQGTFLISPTTFTCAFWEHDELDQFVHIERVEPAGHDLGRLWEIDRLVESIAEGRIDFEQGVEELERIIALPGYYPAWVHAIAWVVAGSSFAALLSPQSLDCLVAGLLSLVIFLITRISSRPDGWRPVVTIVAPFISGIIASGLPSLGLTVNVPFVILSSIILFIPGLAFTFALREISVGQLISGSSRLVDAAMLLVKLFFGAAGGMAVGRLLFTASLNPVEFWPLFPAWKTWPAIVGLSVSLAIVFNIRVQKMIWGLLSALLAFGTSRLGEAWFDMHGGVFLGALAVGLFANLFSRITRGPGSILMIQGLVLLVPGSRTYMILNHWVSGETMLPNSSGASQALMVFIALIAGLLFANAILPARKTL